RLQEAGTTIHPGGRRAARELRLPAAGDRLAAAGPLAVAAAHARPLGRHAAQRQLEKDGVMRAPLKSLLVALAAGLSLAVSFFAWHAAEQQQENESRALFDFRVREIAQALGGRMLDYEQVLRGAVGLLAASRDVTAAEWKAYVASLQLDSSYPGIQA